MTRSNDDGFFDLAIGVPGELFVSDGVGVNGVIVVISGSAAGLDSASANRVLPGESFSLIHLGDSGELLFYAANSVADLPATYQLFGSSLACGDFNGDGVSDLAAGAPSALLQGSTSGGAVAIFHGVAGSGLSAGGTQLLTLTTASLEQPEIGDHFGAALCAGDFNGDQISDLAIGIPRDRPSNGQVPSHFFGSVARVPGAVGGLDASNAVFFYSQYEYYVGFGAVLAAGDFDGSGRDRLVIAQPVSGGGDVFVIGDVSVNLGDVELNQDVLFGRGNDENGDAFGHALAVGDFNTDGRDDLAIGAPYEDLGNITDAGEVSIVYGSPIGLATNNTLATALRVPAPKRWNQNSSGIQDSAEVGDRFGFSLTASNFGRNQTVNAFPLLPRLATATDLAVGVPFEGVSGVGSAGAVNVLYGRTADRFGTGLASTNNQQWTQDASGANPPQRNAQFGRALP